MSEEGKTSNVPIVFSEEELFDTIEGPTPPDDGGQEMNIVSASDFVESHEEEEEIEEGQDPNAMGLYKTLVEKGIFSEDEKFQGTWDAIDDKLSELPYLVKQQIIENSPEPVQKLFDYVFADERTVTKETLKEFLTTYLEDTQEMTPQAFESDDSARQYLKQAFAQNSAIKDDEVDIMLDVLEEKGELKSRAEALEQQRISQKSNKHEELLEQRKAQASQQQEAQKEFSHSVVKALDETGWRKTRINDIKKSLSSQQTQRVFTQAWNSPKALIQLANLGLYFDLEKGEFDFDEFVKQVASKDIKNLKDKQIQDNFSSSGTKSKGRDGKRSSFSAFDSLEPII